ncbi:MAG TPA: hypothetical protein VMR95_03655 [Candidatus Binatia bacterium]|nr:hypothetical protein [Candidatus Binatia bacterium]
MSKITNRVISRGIIANLKRLYGYFNFEKERAALKHLKVLKKVAVNVMVFGSMVGIIIGSGAFSTRIAARPTSYSAPGENYQICNEQSEYLTSPWTYDSLSSGSQSYTVAQYEALSGYGTTLPPLPSYISSQASTTEAAVIFAPGSSAIQNPAYDFPESPIVYYFEGGSYGQIGLQSVSGDEFIGGSASGYPEPEFNDGGNAGGINDANDTYGFTGTASTLTTTASASATTVTVSTAIPSYVYYVTFSDGYTDHIASYSSTAPYTITLDTPLPNSESGSVWTSGFQPIAEVNATASQGADSLTLTNASIPLVSSGSYVIGDDTYELTSVSGSQSGYTIGVSGLDTAVSANTPIFYNLSAGGVSVEYLNISDDQHVTTGTLTLGPGWTVEHDDIHDGYSTPGAGVAIYGGDESTIEYNCFARMGDYGAGGSGTNEVFDYNEVLLGGYEADPGCGCSGGGKWWGTLNTNIVDNAFIENGIGGGQPTIWFDNGNSGALVEGNYFYLNAGPAVDNETGYNMKVDDNLFLDNGWGDGTGQASNGDGAVDLNSSGGIYVPNSRYEDQILISNNQFINNWEGITIWQSDQRNCLGSGEGWPVDSAYCSGGFPNTDTTAAGGQYYFSHQGDLLHNGTTTVTQPVSGGSSTVLVQGPEAIDDQIGFSNATTTSDTTNITSFTGSGTINVTSTSGFPTTGQLFVDTSNGEATVTYTNDTATTFTGVSLISSDPYTASSGTLNGAVQTANPAYTSTSSTTNVSSFGGSGTIIAPTLGFASSGQMRVDTSAAGGGGGFTGAILAYTGLGATQVACGVSSTTCFTGVSLVRGSGTLTGTIQQIQPYKVTAETCYANDCSLTVTPSIANSVAIGTQVSNAGTCPLYATSVATPTNPMDPATSPNTESYWDGCQWEARNVSVSGNTFFFQPSAIAASAPPEGNATSTDCTTVNNCGTNFMAFQSGGTAPFIDFTGGNAMMSSSSFTGCPAWDSGCSTDPLSNLNALASPPAAQANNGEVPYNNVWSDNTYEGPWSWSDVYSFSGCNPLPTDSTTGKSLPSSDCGAITFSQWQAAWQQDNASTFNPVAATVTGLTANQEIYGPSQAVDSYLDSGTAGTITGHLQVNSSNVGSALTSAPYNFNIDTLNYGDGTYTIGVSGTDTGSNTNSASTSVYIANGDLNDDGEVNGSDVSILAGNWGATTGKTYQQGSILENGEVNGQDLSVLAGNWGWSE